MEKEMEIKFELRNLLFEAKLHYRDIINNISLSFNLEINHSQTLYEHCPMFSSIKVVVDVV